MNGSSCNPSRRGVHTRWRPDEIVEAASSALENALHDKRRQAKHCVRELKREKEKMHVLEECAVVLAHELQKQRSHIQSGMDDMADAVRDLHECRQQLRRRRLQWHSDRAGDCLGCLKEPMFFIVFLILSLSSNRTRNFSLPMQRG